MEKFGLRGKHIAAAGRARERPLGQGASRAARPDTISIRPRSTSSCTTARCGGPPVWQAAPYIAYRVGATNAFAIEYDNVSHGTPVALRVARDLLRAEPELRNVLVVAACRESYLLDYGNERSRFMFNFGDGAVAGLLVGDGPQRAARRRTRSRTVSFSLQVKVPAGGSVEPASVESVGDRRLSSTSPTRRR